MCTGSCPSCTHSGSYGADCSGFAAKVWVVPGSNTVLSDDSHPYSTYHFENEYHGWHSVDRGSMKRADALVYNEGNGHIFIYEKGDPWGNMYAYECRGCADGCDYNIRSASSAYKAISRDGITDSLPEPSDTFTGRWYLRDATSAGANNIPGFTYGGPGGIPLTPWAWSAEGCGTCATPTPRALTPSPASATAPTPVTSSSWATGTATSRTLSASLAELSLPR